jgi:hypothetical protein
MKLFEEKCLPLWVDFLSNRQIIEGLKNSSKNENTTKGINQVLWLTVWRKWCIEKKIQREYKIFRDFEIIFCSIVFMLNENCELKKKRR